MAVQIDPQRNYEATREAIGYVNRKDAKQEDYDRIGFMSGLEVHQQLLTEKKLFCHCPAGRYHGHDDYDAELIRHMRPTLSELGEYDGTALMEFKTRKQIIYRINNETACTYEVDDTPPFPVDRQALEISLFISLLSKLNIVGEVHVTRKQYLDGSIPTGFQRTAIIGVEGEIALKHKKIRLIQLSLEEDSCREISDIGHTRIFKTDRLGMPLIETVTYPDMTHPDEVKEACDYIRFLNRSTGMVRTGIGAGRQDVNVSCRGGHRVEIKGVAHTKWIPELTHVEAFRQWALLHIREILLQRVKDANTWEMKAIELPFALFSFPCDPISKASQQKEKIYAVNLPYFQGLLSYFTQPGHTFASEFTDRLKVIACIEKPNMATSEDRSMIIANDDFDKIKELLHAGEHDAQIVFWGPADDIKTALETIEERSRMAFEGIPPETRKSFSDGTTIFERVLPGADRMYPDTDTAPIPLDDAYIEELRKKIPNDVIERYQQLKQWDVPEDCYTFILSKNLFPLIEKLVNDLNIDPKFAGSFIGQYFKYVIGHYHTSNDFSYNHLYDLFEFIVHENLDVAIARKMLPVWYEHPKMDFESVLT
ncbi:MAG: Glu-tRNA(Gln) amidotransferase subunit GatE, partial [Bacteroidales bacterium]|nr:Glu-tRNA(Gln) amidotransferase subunit GatE [Bacteroidales bacterium]